eukprot:scaffold20104_cov120-Isochrysis_galbana.AAC.1
MASFAASPTAMMMDTKYSGTSPRCLVYETRSTCPEFCSASAAKTRLFVPSGIHHGRQHNRVELSRRLLEHGVVRRGMDYNTSHGNFTDDV